MAAIEETTGSNTDIMGDDAAISGSSAPKALSSVVLTEDEQSVLERQTTVPTTSISSVRFLLSCTSLVDGTILIISSLAAIFGGAASPISMLLLGNMTESFRGYFIGKASAHEFNASVQQLSLFYIYLAAAEFIAIYLATVGFTLAGERITQRIRERYLAAVLRQNIAYFEGIGVGEISHRLTADTTLIQDAITGKASLTLTALAAFISALGISFYKSWRLALVTFPAQVLIVGSMGFGSRFIIKYTIQNLAAYARGSTIVEEAIRSIQTVTAFGMQETLESKYRKYISSARGFGIRSGISQAAMLGMLNAVIFWSYGVAFHQGSRFIIHDQASLSAIMTILFANIHGAFALGNISPHMQAFVSGMMATKKISETISRQPQPDATQPGQTLEYVAGHVEFRNVRHVYPSRPGVLVLEGLNSVFPPAQMTAIVGASGCGKSTLVSLLERFYEPISGLICLDGHDISTLDLTWLRQQIGLVSQEPTLLSTTIFENIRFGLVGTPYEHSPAEDVKKLIEQAAQTANAYDFIMDLSDGFQTHVGDGGAFLSGGQRQRIAIARAVISDPKILLLDEATSALDFAAERAIQKALEQASQGRTTIVIAHRLSTITAADNIIVMSQGRVVEQGTHTELLAKGSVYSELVKRQTLQEGLESNTSLSAASDDSESEDEDEVPLIGIEDQHAPLLPRKLSTVSSVVDLEQKPEAKSPSTLSLVNFVFGLNKSEYISMLGGFFFSIIAGASHPAQAIFLAKLLEALSQPPNEYDQLPNYDKMLRQVDWWSFMYVLVGLNALVGWLGQGVCFAFYSQQLTFQARQRSFHKMLHLDVSAFFTLDSSSCSGILANSAVHLQGMSGVALGTIIVIVTQLVAGFTLAMVVGWKLGVVCAFTIPVQIGCGIFRLKCQALLEAHSKKAYESSAAYACEYSAAIRTVAALTLEEKIQKDYHEILDEQRRKSLMSISQSSLLYAASQSFNLLCVALAFWYGSRMIIYEHYTMFQFFVCFTAVVTGAYSAGAIFSFAPDIGKARAAAEEIKELYDKPIDIDSRDATGTSVDCIDGTVRLDNVSFRYSNRPKHLVLDGVSLNVQAGQYVALVGASGSGKSTIVSLLERFFDPEKGGIVVDGVDLRSWNVQNLRRHLALVGQTPTLYDGTIRDNIVISLNGEFVDEEAIVQASKDAGIYETICSLPDGFNTMVGGRGTMLSGGQKQRIAIARALLRQPKVLLLDEATSALDTESEAIVQAALDRAAKGRTTVAIAHRISTIEKADCIYVLHHGRIVEQGTHMELLEKRGRYFDLVQLQKTSYT